MAVLSAALAASLLTTGSVFADTKADGCQETGNYEVCVTNPDQAGDGGEDHPPNSRVRVWIDQTKEAEVVTD